MTLQEYLDKYGLKQKDAAVKFNTSEAMISRLLAKKRKPGRFLKEHIQRKTAKAVTIEDWT